MLTPGGAATRGIEPLLLTTTQIATYDGPRLLTRATGFFFERGDRLFLVTSRHVLFDRPSGHTPNRIDIVLHTQASDIARVVPHSVLLYEGGKATWRQGRDSAGEVDVAVLELPRAKLPPATLLHAFQAHHLLNALGSVEVGAPLLLVGFPLGFHDTLHHLPVVRHAIVSSSFGLRFQGEGLFITDARAHRGSSGAPVVMRCAPEPADGGMPFKLLGVHSSRMDMKTRDLQQDESLGLNCAWYADIVLALTRDAAPA